MHQAWIGRPSRHIRCRSCEDAGRESLRHSRAPAKVSGASCLPIPSSVHSCMQVREREGKGWLDSSVPTPLRKKTYYSKDTQTCTDYTELVRVQAARILYLGVHREPQHAEIIYSNQLQVPAAARPRMCGQMPMEMAGATKRMLVVWRQATIAKTP